MYRPSTRVSTRQFPYLALVAAVDADFQQRKHNEIEYAFSGRVFTADPAKRGAYNQFSNVYPVGAAHGAIDPIYNGRPFYSGVPTGSWA